MKIVIPVRYASTRLPGKPLVDIAGKTMIEHVWERAKEAATDSDEILIAADDTRILEAAEGFGAVAVATHSDHASGTDRIAEIAAQMGWAEDEIIVNLQGDEPLMPPALIRMAGEVLAGHPEAAIATASCEISAIKDVENPNIVKVVTAEDGTALYFSRSPIPHDRSGALDISKFSFQRHIGLYAYRAKALCTLAALPPAPLEQLEGLEQLRALAAGLKIYVHEIENAPPHGVDTPADLKAVRQTLGHVYA